VLLPVIVFLVSLVVVYWMLRPDVCCKRKPSDTRSPGDQHRGTALAHAVREALTDAALAVVGPAAGGVAGGGSAAGSMEEAITSRISKRYCEHICLIALCS
jgi:hypothetical protein